MCLRGMGKREGGGAEAPLSLLAVHITVYWELQSSSSTPLVDGWMDGKAAQ